MKHLRKTSAIAVFLVCASTQALAGGGDQAPSLFASSLKTLGALILVLALVLVAAWAARRYLHFLPQGVSKGDDIRVLSVKALGPKRSIHLLEIEGEKILIGTSENGVTLLKDFGSSTRGK